MLCARATLFRKARALFYGLILQIWYPDSIGITSGDTAMPTSIKVFDGAAATIYERFTDQLPYINYQYGQIVDALVPINPRVIVEVGSGTGRLAQEVLDIFLFIDLYLAIEPSESMRAAMPAELMRREQFIALPTDFENWVTSRLAFSAPSIDAIISRYTFHDYPELLPEWYRQIANVLRPGGRFINLDAYREEKEYDRRFFTTMLCFNAQRVPVYNKAEEEARDRLVQHLQQEAGGYLSLDQHCQLLLEAGLVPHVHWHQASTYLISADKPG